MNKRVYNILFILLFTFSVSFLFMESGYASSAYCEYKYASANGKCSITFSVTYQSGNVALSYNEISSKEGSYVDCTFNYSNFTKQDFVDSNGNVICPNLTATYEASAGSNARTSNVEVTIMPTTANSDDTITLVDSDISNDSSSSSGSSSESDDTTYVCYYETSSDCGSFYVSYNNGSVAVNLATTSSAYTIYNSLIATEFENGACPNVYVSSYVKNNKRTCSYSNTQYSGATKVSGTKYNQNTGSTGSSSSSSSGTTISFSDTDYDNFCSIDNVQTILKIVGYLVTIIKIVAPLLLIIMGTVDFAKAITSGDDKSMSLSLRAFIIRLVSAVIIFLIPTIIKMVFNIVDSDWKNETGFYQCVTCVLETSECGN